MSTIINDENVRQNNTQIKEEEKQMEIEENKQVKETRDNERNESMKTWIAVDKFIANSVCR